ncbi:MAG: hypothetical protein NC213_07815 [Acetobacter sp.]|nr:hypothetical protein [Bacteroides sp.]MCM1341636.1 hypothetical protein [Acetobacter sp.]MCM1434043.1 hypothetical protein [Clostridiales bacterium]
MKKVFLSSTVVISVLFGVFLFLTLTTGNSLCYTLAITFATMCYHFIMRLTVGKFIPHSFNFKTYWFREKSFEKSLYKVLKVKKWKDKMPSYNPTSYMTRDNKIENIVNTMCRNEIIHEVNALLSFVPILFSLAFGAIFVFVITSIIACCVDLIFVVMQRYNRPRLIRLIERINKRN